MATPGDAINDFISWTKDFFRMGAAADAGDGGLNQDAGRGREEAFFLSRYVTLQPSFQDADRITTVTNHTQKAKAEYDLARKTVEAAAEQGDYPAATLALPRLTRAVAHFLALQDEAAVERQTAKGPMTTAALASNALADEQKKAGLQDGAKSRNCEIGRLLADRLINDDGKLEVVGLFLNDPDETAQTLGDSPHSKQLARTLKKLREDPELQKKVSSIGKPNPKNPACELIRSSLGLRPNEEVTEVHARKAALSAMLAELRQSDVGSCFATSTAIRVHDGDPGRLLDDLKELIETGMMTRDFIQQDGKKVRYEVPISMPVSGATLARKVTVGQNGDLGTKHLSAAPPVRAALAALGFADDDPEGRKKVVDDALAALRASNVQAAKAAISGALPEKIKESGGLLSWSGSKEVLNKTREDLLARIPALLAGQTGSLVARTALENELRALPDQDRTAILNAFDDYPNKTDHEFTPEDIVTQCAMATAGISETDLKARDRLAALNLKLRAIRGGDPQTYYSEADKLEPDWRTLDAEYVAKRKKFAKYEELVDAAKNGYLAQEDNRLLRGWEYSVTAMAEQGISKEEGPAMKAAAEEQVQKVVSDTVLELFGSAPLEGFNPFRAGKALQSKFASLWDENTRMGYDASKEGELSADGSSNKGAFCLFDKAGIDDPNQHIAVNDKGSYSKLIEGLINKARLEVTGTEKDPEILKCVEKIAAAVADKAAKDPDAFVSGATKNLQERNKKYKEPWALVEGAYMTPILSTYYGHDVSASVETTQASNPEELTNWLLASGRKLMANIPDADKNLTPETIVPMSGGPHTWNFRPGDPRVRKLMESGEGATEFKNAEKEKYESQKSMPLTPQSIRMLIEDAFEGLGQRPQTLNEVVQAIRTIPNCKGEDVITRVKEFFVTNDPDRAVEAERRASLSIMKNIAPPVEVANLEAHLDGIVKKLKLGDDEAQHVKAYVTQRVNAPVSMSELETLIVAGRKDKNSKLNEREAAAAVCRAQRPLEPLGLPFGDANWGGGDHHILFTMLRNPISGDVEMWQCNEDGSAPAKLDTEQWIKGQQWEMTTKPAVIGGLV